MVFSDYDDVVDFCWGEFEEVVCFDFYVVYFGCFEEYLFYFVSVIENFRIVIGSFNNVVKIYCFYFGYGFYLNF